ncbi:MAG: hypothetical protein GIW98_02085 [Candidatus Eremiobacteraeota bacterium]|nr:hypothetical protein [Candidatus Eremiobacteraeota bacterium]
MSRVKFSIALAFVLAVGCLPRLASAAIETDPGALYRLMKGAYDQGAAHGWTFSDQQYYLSTIFSAGRAYSLFDSSNTAYAELAFLTVEIASGLHYNPLTNHDAVPWYVREAAAYVITHGNPDQTDKAKALVQRVEAIDDPIAEARLADQDATDNLRNYRRDPDALLQQVEADWRAFVLTKDISYRSLAFARSAEYYFPVQRLPDTYGNDLLSAAKTASDGYPGYSAGEVLNAKQMLDHLKKIAPLRVIGTVRALTHDEYLTTLAPADEYFGRTGMSVLGIKNELKRLNQYLDAGYGSRESNAGVLLADAIDGLHKVYPKDRDLPAFLYEAFRTLSRISTGDARTSAAHMRTILTIEYSDTFQARQLLAS